MKIFYQEPVGKSKGWPDGMIVAETKKEAEDIVSIMMAATGEITLSKRSSAYKMAKTIGDYFPYY